MAQATFQLKGSIFTLQVLCLLDNDIPKLVEGLKEHIAKSPKYFQFAPLVIDIQKVNWHKIHFSALAKELRALNFIPVGVRTVHKEAAEVIHGAGLGYFPVAKQEEKDTSADEAKPVEVEITSTLAPATLLITQPVRSGQQIYAENADLIVTASVSQGAELLADGHIHVYGPLRGRALAGVRGNETARIFCQKLEAELISIAGRYFVSEDLQQVSKKPMCVSLDGGQLSLKPL